jgi:hypothetical protein
MKALLLLIALSSCAYHYETSFGEDVNEVQEKPEVNRTR